MQRPDMPGPALDDVTKQRACLVEMTGRARGLRAAHRIGGLRIVLAARGRALESQQTQGATADGDEGAEGGGGG